MDVYSESNEILTKIYHLTNKIPGKFISFKTIQDSILGPTPPADDTNKLCFMLDDILTDFKKYLEKKTIGETKYKISPAGFAWIYDNLDKHHNSNNAFCAMWFDNSTDQAWSEGIKPAITEASFTARRIDQAQFNDDINAMMIIMINISRFIIADFTGDRGGVYFEAGYAHGLKIPVIYTCHKQSWDSKRPHFDIEHYNFILWDQNDLNSFKDKLKDRIINTII